MTDTTRDATFGSDDTDLARRIAELERRLAAQDDGTGADRPGLADRMTGFGNTARARLRTVSDSGGFPIWAVLLVCALALFGAVEVLDDLHVF